MRMCLAPLGRLEVAAIQASLKGLEAFKGFELDLWGQAAEIRTI